MQPATSKNEPFRHATIVEKAIAFKVIDCLLDAGYSVTVNDGEENVIKRSRDRAAIADAMNSTGEDYLAAHDGNNKVVGRVYLVYGNDIDLISDYSMTLESAMQPAMDLANQLQDLEDHPEAIDRLCRAAIEANSNGVSRVRESVLELWQKTPLDQRAQMIHEMEKFIESHRALSASKDERTDDEDGPSP